MYIRLSSLPEEATNAHYNWLPAVSIEVRGMCFRRYNMGLCASVLYCKATHHSAQQNDSTVTTITDSFYT
jgi:hypothetical protein